MDTSGSFDPDAFAAALVRVDGEESLASLSPDTQGIVVSHPRDALLGAVVAHLPGLRHLITDGNGREITDAGVAHLCQLPALESLDLEWSAVTDSGLSLLASLPSLRWVDIGGAAGVTSAGIAALRASRPDLEVEAHGL